MTTLDQTMKNLTPEAVSELIEHQIAQLHQKREVAVQELAGIDAQLALLEPALAALRPGCTRRSLGLDANMLPLSPEQLKSTLT